MTAAENKETSRTQLAKVVDLKLSPARIRTFIDNEGINNEHSEKSNAIKLMILVIKKEGGPRKPEPPAQIKKDAPESQKAALRSARAKYDKDMAVYNAYTSARYERLEQIYGLCKQLNKMYDILVKGKRTEANDRELESLRLVVNDKPALRKEKESELAYKARLEKFVKPGYAQYLGDAKLDNPDSIMETITRLKRENPGLDLFFSRDVESKSRTRFNDASSVALATALELALEELLDHGMETTLKSQKKTLQPDHCISDGLEKKKFYAFFRDLPHFQAVLERQKRKAKYIEDRDAKKTELYRKMRVKARKDGKAYSKPKFEYPTFNDVEVANGYAYKEEKVDEKGEKKYNYYWYGIEAEREDAPVSRNNINFKFYVNAICRKIIQDRSDSGDASYDEIKISDNIREFGSHLIVDFIAKIDPLIKILLDCMGVRTIDDKIICAVLRMLILSSYQSVTGKVDLDEEHQKLFDLIDEKVKLCKAHQTGAIEKEEAEEKSDSKGHTEDPTEVVVPTETKDDDEDDLEEELKSAASAPVKKVEEVVAKKVAKQELMEPVQPNGGTNGSKRVVRNPKPIRSNA